MNKFGYLFLAGMLWACGSSTKEEKNTADTSNNTETTVIEKTESIKKVKKETVNQSNNVTLNFHNTYTGKINDKYEIVMEVEKSESYFTGTYKYKGKDQTIYLRSKSKTGNSYVLEEYVYNEKGTLVTGFFEGTLNDNIFSGTWFSADRSKSFPFSVKTNSSTFNFTSNVNLDENGSTLTFTILDANNSEIQKIEVEQTTFPDSSITVEDMNFDGYSDIRIVNFVAANGNTNYSCWLYNPDSQKFENNETLTQLADPIFHQNTKQVNTTWKEGYGTYGHETYQYQNNKYLLIESGYTNMNEEGEESTTTTKYKIVDGKSVKI